MPLSAISPGLEFCHHFAAVVTQCACRIEIGVVAFPDETTVTAQQRRIVDERGLERVDQGLRHAIQPLTHRLQLCRQRQRAGSLARKSRPLERR